MMETPQFKKKIEEKKISEKKINLHSLYFMIATTLPVIIGHIKEDPRVLDFNRFRQEKPKIWDENLTDEEIMQANEVQKRLEEHLKTEESKYKKTSVLEDEKEKVPTVKEEANEDTLKADKKKENKILEKEPLFEDKSRETITIDNFNLFKTLKPELPYYYKQIHPEDIFENLQLPGKITKHGITSNVGKLILALRFKPVVDMVMVRYKDFPEELRGVLLSQIIEESTGLLYLPNSLGDGGFGVIHMQGQTAHEFGLNTYDNCNAMVCNGKDERSCKTKNGKKKNHAADVKWIIDSGKYDRDDMAKKDERLHPILNIDAAARMLLTYYYGPKIEGLTRAETAIRRYSGKYNYKAYKSDIEENMKMINSKEEYRKAEEYFNSINKNFTINGEPGNLKKYLEANRLNLENYGCEPYRKSPKVKFNPAKS